MIKRRTLKNRILLRVSLKRDIVFTRGDFKELGDYDQVGRALKQLSREQKLIRIGYGLYAKAKLSKITGTLVPQSPLPNLAIAALTKLKVKIYPTTIDKQYNTGNTTQIPTGRMIAVQGRIIRKIGYNGAYIHYERKA